MAFTNGLDIGDFSIELSSGNYVSQELAGIFTQSIDLGDQTVELSSGNYISQQLSSVFTQALDIGDFTIEFGTSYVTTYRVNTYTPSAVLYVSALAVNPGDDGVLLVFGAIVQFDYSTLKRTVTFTDTTHGIVTAWNWSFGDGSTSTEQNPIHKFPGKGTYTVTLSATFDTGNVGTASQRITITFGMLNRIIGVV
jgi:uncharacterized membrane protein